MERCECCNEFVDYVDEFGHCERCSEMLREERLLHETNMFGDENYVD